MTNTEIIEKLELLAALIEWEFDIDYQVVIKEAVKIIREADNGQKSNQ